MSFPIQLNLECECGYSGEFEVVKGTPPHWGQSWCPQCTKHRWVSDPDKEQKNRPAKDRNLVKKYSRGFCELCLRWEKDLVGNETLEAHHVLEFKDGGEPNRENIWIVCTVCHAAIGFSRKWYFRSFEKATPDKVIEHELESDSRQNTGLSPQNEAVGSLATREARNGHNQSTLPF